MDAMEVLTRMLYLVWTVKWFVLIGIAGVTITLMLERECVDWMED